MAVRRAVMSVSIDGLRNHANSLRLVADEADGARQAATTVRLGGAAYGQLLTWLPTVVDWLQDQVIDAMNGSLEVLDNSADGLDQIAMAYRNTDQNAANDYRRILS
jgi:uncharacterized protein YukE